MKKGIGPNNLGAPKGVGKMYKATPAKQVKPGEPKKKEKAKSYEPSSLAGFGGPRYVAGKIKKGVKKVKKTLSNLDDYIGAQTQKEATKDLNNRRFK